MSDQLKFRPESPPIPEGMSEEQFFGDSSEEKQEIQTISKDSINNNKKNEKYIIAYGKFFELLNKYDMEFIKFKKSKTYKKKSEAEKIIAVEEFLENRKCIKCKNIGGTNFEKNAEFLKATCNCRTPCDLDITVMLGDKIHHKDELFETFETNIQEIKQKITKDKLKLLFDLEKDEVVLQSFQTNKSDLILTVKEFNRIKKGFEDQDKITIQSNIDRLKKLDNIEQDNEEKTKESDENKDERTLKRNMLLKNYNKELNEAVAEYNNNIQKYKSTNEEEELEIALRDYIKIIMPLKEKIRQTKYSSIHIDIEPNGKDLLPKYYVKKNPKDIKDLLTKRNNHKAISNKY
jgi:hypothetical protein